MMLTITFVNEIKLISQKATEIYCEDMPADCKKQKLLVLMSGLVDDGIISQVATPLHNALQKTFADYGKHN